MLLCMTDDVELATGILAAMYLGAVAVPCSTMLTGGELGKLVVDSRARVLLGSHQFAGDRNAAAANGAGPAPRRAHRRGRHRPRRGHADCTWAGAARRRAAGRAVRRPGTSRPRSGSTPPAPPARPRARCTATPTSASSPRPTAHQVLGIGRDDVCLSVAKLFFAYGIGNSMFFPLAGRRERGAGASRPNPALFADRIREHGVTLFFAVPSFWGPLIAADLPPETFATVRNGVSAGRGAAARGCTTASRTGTASRSSTASAPPRRCTSSSPTCAGKVVPGSSGVPGARLRRASCAAPTAR